MTASEDAAAHLAIWEQQPQARLQVIGFLAEFERRLTLTQSPQEPTAESTASPG